MGGYRTLTTVVLVAHFCYLLYVVLGGFLAWRWPRTIWVHAVAAVWGLLIAVHAVECPLTYAENWSRERAGEAAPTVGFIDRYVEGVLYPERYTVVLQVLAGVAVLGSWIGFAILRRRAHRRGTRPDTTRKSEESSGSAATV